MPLLDHFHPPLSIRRHWHSFHNAWATYLSSHLNEQLPEGYFAESNVQFGIEIDVATFEESNGSFPNQPSWHVPTPTISIPMVLLEESVEVTIYQQMGGAILAGAIELVRPANKDRSAHREAFVSKCVTYLQQGIGLVLVDIVTDRLADLHQELVERYDGNGLIENLSSLYAVAYRPVKREEQSQLDIWYHGLHLGQALPTLPLWLRGHICLPVDLEKTYQRTCQEQRVRADSA